MPWVSRMLRGQKVWARAEEGGALAAGPDGRVDVLYKQGGKVYRAGARNLEPDPKEERWSDEEAAPGDAAEAKSDRASSSAGGSGKAGTPVGAASRAPMNNPYVVYADGACSGNPGPAGLGVVILDGKERKEVSEYLGTGTNNIAELMAIVRALELAPRDRTVLIHSDSSYALGLLGKGWKPKANQELVARMKQLAKEFKDLRLIKVQGHAGVAENERADQLARDAVIRRR